YDFLIERGELTPHPEMLARVRADPDDAPRIVSEHGQRERCSVAARALDLFVELYAAVAGDYALVTLATDGVFLDGGIAPKILPELTNGRFLRAFRDKGR